MTRKRSTVARELERRADANGYGDELREFRKTRPRLSKTQREQVGRILKAPKK